MTLGLRSVAQVRPASGPRHTDGSPNVVVGRPIALANDTNKSLWAGPRLYSRHSWSSGEACAAIPSERRDEADPRGLTSLHLAALRGHAGCVQVLLERGARVEVQTRMALSQAILIDAGLDPRTTDRHGHAPGHYAERNGFDAMCALLAQAPNCNAASRA